VLNLFTPGIKIRLWSRRVVYFWY